MRGPLRILFTGVILLAGCAGPLPPVVMHGPDPADPAAPVTPFEAPPNMLALGVDIQIQQEEEVATHEHADDQATSLYACPMHPEVTADAPGQCPECGMNLIKESR